MARLEVLKRIKDDILIENRIQIYRVHFNYLKTCLKYPKEFKVDKSKYKGWDLDIVERYQFDSWWKKIGRDLMGRDLRPIRRIKTPSFNPRPNTTVLEIPNDTPTEYALEKMREILNNSKVSQKKETRIHHFKLEIYLESWKLRRDDKLTMLQIRKKLINKRNEIFKRYLDRKQKEKAKGNKKFKQSVVMVGTENFLKYRFDSSKNKYGGNEQSLQRQISRYKRKADKVLVNVSNGVFPGDYTDD